MSNDRLKELAGIKPLDEGKMKVYPCGCGSFNDGSKCECGPKCDCGCNAESKNVSESISRLQVLAGNAK